MQGDADRILSPEEAQHLILEHIEVLSPERVGLLQAHSRVLAEDIPAATDIPPWDNSAMDGYAVRWESVADAAQSRPVSLEMIEDLPAGAVAHRVVGPHQASRIMTGAPIPEGADTVIRVEYTRAEDPRVGSRIEILRPEPRGANIRRRGEDMGAGRIVLRAGTRCGPGEIGTLAALQRSFVHVSRRPRVAVLSTGDELVEVDEPLTPGTIVNANSYSLAALAQEAGAQPVVLPLARDREAELRAAVQGALGADFIVSSGGVSMGAYDLVRKVLDDLGSRFVLWRVAMKPGKPLFFCMLGSTPYFGVPGNTVSSMMSFLQFVRPALRKASGLPEAEWLLPETRAVLDVPVSNKGDRRRYLRAQVRYHDGAVHVAPQSGQGSHMLTSMLGANGFLVVEPGQRSAPGDLVRVQIFGQVAGRPDQDEPA